MRRYLWVGIAFIAATGVVGGLVWPRSHAQEGTLLAPGFNLVVWTAPTAAVTDALAPIDGRYEAVFHWDAATQQYESFHPGVPATLNTLQTLTAGEPYWILTPTGASLPLPSGTVGAAPEAPPLTEFALVGSDGAEESLRLAGGVWQIDVSATLDGPFGVSLSGPGGARLVSRSASGERYDGTLLAGLAEGPYTLRVNATGPWEIRLARRSSLQAVLGLGGSTVGPGEYQCQGPAGWELTTPRTDDTAVFSCDDDNAVLWLRLDADAQTWRIDGTGDRFSETPVTAMIYDSQGGVAAVGGAGRTGGGVPEETYGPGLAAGVYAVAVVGGPWTMSISGVAEGGGPGGVATP